MDLLSLHMDASSIRASLELHSDGDANFRSELITLMISDLKDLKEAFQEAVQTSCPDLFFKVVHKIKVTLEILCADRLIEAVSHSQLFFHGDDFIHLCEELISALRTELATD